MFGKIARIVALASLVVSILAPTASAVGPGSLARTHAMRNAFLVEGKRVGAPFAHIIFCKERPEECAPAKRTRWGRAPVHLTGHRMKELNTINSGINQAISPKSDKTAMGGDEWALAPRAGDCEDYALTKRHVLITKGWPARNLRLAITYTSFGEGHLVLVVKTNAGDLVLDNRVDAIRKWNKSGLKWRMIQASLDPRQWLTL